jgi:hypothetical protein
MLNCVRSTRCPRPCSRCRRPLAGREAHLPVFHTGVFCAERCLACREASDPMPVEGEIDFKERTE